MGRPVVGELGRKTAKAPGKIVFGLINNAIANYWH
jgi:hypothetical protein